MLKAEQLNEDGSLMLTSVLEGTDLEGNVSVESLSMRPHTNTTRHRHNKSSVVVYIVDGDGHFEIDGKEYVCRKGMQFQIRPGTAHQIFASGKGLEFISVQSPAIMQNGEVDYEAA